MSFYRWMDHYFAVKEKIQEPSNYTELLFQYTLILIVYYQSTQINGIQIQILAYISSCMIQTDQIARSKAAVIIITGTVNR